MKGKKKKANVSCAAFGRGQPPGGERKVAEEDPAAVWVRKRGVSSKVQDHWKERRSPVLVGRRGPTKNRDAQVGTGENWFSTGEIQKRTQGNHARRVGDTEEGTAD